jgi:hypothetical protein
LTIIGFLKALRFVDSFNLSFLEKFRFLDENRKKNENSCWKKKKKHLQYGFHKNLKKLRNFRFTIQNKCKIFVKIHQKFIPKFTNSNKNCTEQRQRKNNNNNNQKIQTNNYLKSNQITFSSTHLAIA